MKSTMKKKSYYLFTHPQLPEYVIENFGDRTMLLKFGRCTQYKHVRFSGDVNWDITEENIHRAAEAVFNSQIKEFEQEQKEEQERKSKSVWSEIDDLFEKMNATFDKLFKK